MIITIFHYTEGTSSIFVVMYELFRAALYMCYAFVWDQMHVYASDDSDLSVTWSALSLPCSKDWQQFQCCSTEALVHEQGQPTSAFIVKANQVYEGEGLSLSLSVYISVMVIL